MSERPEGVGEMGNAAPKPVNPIEESRGPATAVPAPVPAPAVPVPAAADTAVPSDNAPDTAMTPADQPTAVSRSAPAAPLEAQSTMPEGTPAPAQMTVSPAATLGALSTGKDATLLIDSAAKPQDPAVTAAMDTSEKNTAPVAASAPSPTASNAATAPTATSVLTEAISAPVPALKEEPAPKHVQGSPPKCKPEPANTTAKTATSSQRDTPQPIALASVVSGASAQEAEPLRVEGSASAKTTSPIITTPSSVQPAPSGSEAASNSNTGSSSAEPMELSDVPKPPAAATVEAPQALLVPEPPPVDAQVHLAGAPQPTAGSTSGVQETLPMDTASGHSPAPAKDQVVLASVASAAPANPTNLSPVSTNGHAAPVSVRTAPKQLQETNLYALQHEKDAVHWYPWGSDAFDLATKENKPIFLSIGYSTCHWCHVMARECFQNKEIAAAMNERFINIQVDREERPDIDAIYMLYVQATTGSGGWPMSVWLTPTLKPILGGTYFPPKDAQNRPGFMTLVRRVADAWKTKSKELEAEGSEAVKQLRQHLSRATVPKSGLKPPTNGVLEKTFESIRKTYDPKKGGFSSAPKFPRPAVFQFLSFYYRSMPNTTESKAAIDMASFTLEKMARGGIHDVVGGGFHRYSVTSDFHIPHFEKTLVDNAQLAVSYLEAYQCTKNEEFADVARKTLRYIVNEMRAPEGGYFAAEDADSEGLDGKLQEGGYYLWKYSEMEGILGQDAKLICELFNVTESGNAPVNADPQGHFKNANILIQRQDLSTIAKKQPSRDVAGVVRNGMEKLLAARKHRKRPTIDNKIIAGWNGLAIWALARGYQVLGDKAWLEAALETAKCIHQTLYDVSSKRLVRSFHSERGKSHAAGFASDYAFLIQGLIELYQITFDPYWLRWAIDLQQTQQQLFFDAATGAYWNAVDDHTLLFRTKEDYDGAEPSTNSVSASNLLKLSQLLPDSTEFRRLAEGVVAAFEEQLTKSPLVLPLLSTVAHMLAHPTVQVLLYSPPVGEKDEKYAEDTAAKRLQEMAQVVYAAVLPNKTLVVFDENRRDDSMQWLLSNASSRVGALRSSSQVAAYVCVGGTCKAPVSSADELRAALAVGVGN